MRFRFPGVIYFASSLGLWRGLLLLVSPDGLRTTCMYAFRSLEPVHVFVGIAIIIVSLLGFYGVHGRMPTKLRAGFLYPQLLLVSANAIGPALAMFQGHYADGVHRSLAFISTDQIGAIGLLIAYIVALFVDAKGDR